MLNLKGIMNSMKDRILTKTIKKACTTFPAVVVTGPRQSGKTTLLKNEFGKTHTFVSLEDPNMRMRAKTDPLAFLEQYKPPVILDEIQYVPELLSYIKTKIDQERTPGNWLLSGSQNFVLMDNISQSLAGRVAVLSLLPLTLSEQMNQGENALSITQWLSTLSKLPQQQNKIEIAEWILRGAYPEIVTNKKVDRKLWCGSYIATYLERDVRNMAQVGDLNQFELFLKQCAIRTGQLLNLTELARDVGISVTTAKRWLSLLETSYQVHLLQPYYKNLGKRLVKRPKMYFVDTAIATYLMGIHEAETLLNSPHFGALFESAVINECVKRFTNFGDDKTIYFIRTQDNLEIDLAIENNQKLHLFEIKSAKTITPKHAVSLIKIQKEWQQDVAQASIISRADDNFLLVNGIMNYHWLTVLNA